MTIVDVKAEDIETLVATFDSSGWDEIRVRVRDFEIHLSKTPGDRGGPRTVVEVTSSANEAIPSQRSPPTPAAPIPLPQARNRKVAPPNVASGRGIAAVDLAALPEGMEVVRAPNFGTFYRAPKPGAASYIEVGQRVERETEVCLIEVMKLFTPVRAGVAGTVRAVLVKDSAMVEFDQPLFLIEPE